MLQGAQFGTQVSASLETAHAATQRTAGPGSHGRSFHHRNHGEYRGRQRSEHSVHELGNGLEGGQDLRVSGRLQRGPGFRPASAGAHSLPASEDALFVYRAARA